MAVIAHYLETTDFRRRATILAVVLLAAAAVLVGVSAPQLEADPRFPRETMAFDVPGWTVTDARVEGRPGVAFVYRSLRNQAGLDAQLTITTSPQAKLVYRASVETPFLGSGYTVEAAPGDLVPVQPGRIAQVARRGDEAWLQVASFGERRGGFGNGVVGWSLAVFDMLLGNPNDYYLARVIAPLNAESAMAASQLAESVFPRIAAFYAD